MCPRGSIIISFYVSITPTIFHRNPHACGEGVKAVEDKEEEETVSFAVSLVLL